MGTIQQMYDNWCKEELRSWDQVNQWVWLAWFNKWLLIFQKMILEYVSGKQSTSVAFEDIAKDQDEYRFPEFDEIHNIEDFYSIVQLRVAYHTDKNWNPIYRICKPIDFSEYNISPLENKWETDSQWHEHLKARWGVQRGGPMIWEKVSEIYPRYIFVPRKWKIPNTSIANDSNYHTDIKIFPTPTEDVENGLTLTYNFVQQPIDESDAFSSDSVDLWTLNLPRYFFDAIEDYITFRLYQAENPEQAQWYYQQFENTLHDNIYWLNKDKRPIEEDFANTTYFSHY